MTTTHLRMKFAQEPTKRIKPTPPPRTGKWESVKPKPVPRKSANEDLILPPPKQLQDGWVQAYSKTKD